MSQSPDNEYPKNNFNLDAAQYVPKELLNYVKDVEDYEEEVLEQIDDMIGNELEKEVMNEFAIYDNSTIINWDDNLKIKKKRFCGKIIEEINLDISENSEVAEFIKRNNLENYDERDVCQVLEIKE